MSINKAHITLTAILALLLSVPALCSAQTATENYVKTVTMLDADGTDSLQAVQYYNGLGYPTLSVATAGTDGGTACTLTTYDGAGREKRRYLPVPANGLEYIPVSGVTSMGLFYLDNGFFTESHYDALDRVTAVDIAGDTWRQAGKQDRRNAGKSSVLRCRQQEHSRIHRPFGEEDYGAHRSRRYLLCI